ncbi:hypothetical protein UFOVP354_13 [uncultured Caudovirales phage]|uniref:Uncharacterized protein n=1 Tax=uncultured Caudovirales phage TaxID=2100421 RepID=A0A6J5LZD3_9CAUD|nr:hypothetical protein UFOVP354_13 [uncultured Caudovirales phage]
MLETFGIIIATSIITSVALWLLQPPRVQPHEIDLLRVEILKVDCKVHELASYIEFNSQTKE